MNTNLILSNIYGSNENNNLFVFFKLDDKIYAVSASHTIEVLKLPLIEYPQKMAANIIGFLNYNNLAINILNIRSVLNIENKPFTTDNELIILKTEETMFGLIADSVVDVLPISESNIRHTPSMSSDKFIKMVYMYDETMVSIIDLYAIEEYMKNNQFLSDDNEHYKLLPVDPKSQNIMKNRFKALLEKNISTISSLYNEDQFLIFTLNKINYCMNIQHVKEITSTKNLNITALPYAPEYIEGIINLRGDFYTVVNLKSFLDMEDNSEIIEKEVIVFNYQDRNISFLVDKILMISTLDSDKFINKTVQKNDNKYISAEFIDKESIFNILNVEKLLNDEKLFISIE